MNGKEDSVEDAAVGWFVRMRDEPVSESDRAAFATWLAADPAHAAAFHDLERLWSGLDQVDRRPQPVPEASAPIPFPRPDADALHSPARRVVLRRMAVAASIAAVGGLGAYVATSPSLLADYATAAGEQRAVTLPDGSRLFLNTASAASAMFDPVRRHVVLHAGEAYFEVAKDAARPFTVVAGPGRLTVLGTAFSVRHEPDEVEVLVAESRVRVAGPDGGSAELGPGFGVRVTTSGLGPVESRDIQNALAWRRGRLVFDDVPLAEVLADLERYRRGRIVVMDEAVRHLPVTGAFTIANQDGVLDSIEQTLPVRVVRVTDLLVLVFARDA